MLFSDWQLEVISRLGGQQNVQPLRNAFIGRGNLKTAERYIWYIIYILSVYIIHIMAMGYLFIAYVCMIMAVQHCLQFCTSFQSQMKKMPDWLSRSRRNLFYGLLVVAQLSRFPVRFPCVLLSHCLHWCPWSEPWSRLRNSCGDSCDRIHGILRFLHRTPFLTSGSSISVKLRTDMFSHFLLRLLYYLDLAGKGDHKLTCDLQDFKHFSYQSMECCGIC